MKLDFKLDAGNASDVCLGIIVLQADETLEREFRSILQGSSITLLHSRLPSHPEVTRETLLQMAEDLPVAAGLLPKSTVFDAIAYACTSGATVIGPDVVASKIQTQHSGVPVTDPITAVIAACKELKLQSLGFITPYVPDVSHAMRGLLEENGLSVAGFGSFEQSEEALVSRIAEQSTLEAILNVGKDSSCDGVFVSCTNLRTLGILQEAEKQLGKPVISSNSALLWHLLKLSGAKRPRQGVGQLFERL